ncbi:hypothetical protein FACS1894110_07840 [Spirochaetia bacterium]|nr:hypothetical protein FACS1894110_07840 [Spirochaetia bacterium]
MKKLFTGIILINISVNCFAQEGIQSQLENYDPTQLLAFTIEGNFTNSGEREIIAFYQNKQDVMKGISVDVIGTAYCFVIDGQSDQIAQVYQLRYYGTGGFDDGRNLLNMPMGALGRSIDWWGYSIGRVGDFNGNGRDELYLFQSTLFFSPLFFEFDLDNKDFKFILEGYENAERVELEAVNSAKKQLQFISDGWRYSHEWDESKQMYVGINNNLFGGKDKK